jgi:endonuclease G
MKRTITSTLFVCLYTFLNAQQADILLPSERDREQIIHHEGYSLSYNSSYVQPSWVAYKVVKSQFNRDEVKGKYIPDPQVNTRSADKKDYREGGYIMAQFVNYFDVKQIPGAVAETFYLTNITPMKLAYYNHIWLKTEELIRLWTDDTDGLYVVCGPILSDAPFPTIGDDNVSVPKRYYKAVYDPKNQKAIGFIFKNGMSSGKLNSYAVSIDEIEKESGIDLFPSLADELEKKIEATLDLSKWNFEPVE